MSIMTKSPIERILEFATMLGLFCGGIALYFLGNSLINGKIITYIGLFSTISFEVLTFVYGWLLIRDLIRHVKNHGWDFHTLSYELKP